MPDMLKAAEAASAIASGQSGRSGLHYARAGVMKLDLYPQQEDWRLSDASAFLPFLKTVEQEVLSRDSRIVKVMARLSDSVCEVLMYNSLGELTMDSRPMEAVDGNGRIPPGRGDHRQERVKELPHRGGTDKRCACQGTG